MFSQLSRLQFLFSIFFISVLLLNIECAYHQLPLIESSNLKSSSFKELSFYSTIHSIGIEWDIKGDSNHNATCTVKYSGKEALPLFRVDWYGTYAGRSADRAYNMLAGSILFLTPDTTYQVTLSASDPDGGSKTETITIKTRAIPSLPSGNTYHVEPGSGGGAGTSGNPFKGIFAAQSVAQPGDTFLIHAGDYRNNEEIVDLNVSGEAGNYIVWKEAGDGNAIFARIETNASHIWIEGLKFETNSNIKTYAIRAPEHGVIQDVVISHNDFDEFDYSIFLRNECKDWYITDNIIVGDNDPEVVNFSGEGIELSNSFGHVVAYNIISCVADGISYPLRNCDIYGNDIFDTTGNGIETDFGYANIRVWGNRINCTLGSPLSFQPQFCGPWYFIRNQIVYHNGSEILKLRVQDRFLLAHNTFVSWETIQNKVQMILSSWCLNNLWICAGGDSNPNYWYWQESPCSESDVCCTSYYKANWRTNMDYNGFSTNIVIRWQGTNYAEDGDFSQLYNVVGIEEHSIRVDNSNINFAFSVPSSPHRINHAHHITLKAGCDAVNAGTVLPNINDNYNGSAPDLGANESGASLPQYGPRS